MLEIEKEEVAKRKKDFEELNKKFTKVNEKLRDVTHDSRDFEVKANILTDEKKDLLVKVKTFERKYDEMKLSYKLVHDRLSNAVT